MYFPVVNNLHIGQIVVDNEGRLGQLTEYDSSNNEFGVLLIETGEAIRLSPEFVLSADSTGAQEDFDLVIGPQTRLNVVGEEMSRCLEEKGFCVARLIQGSVEQQEAYAAMLSAEERKELARLPLETEEGYLGRGGRGKVKWLDPDGPAEDAPLRRSDGIISAIAEILQPYAEDTLGSPIAERTPALACLTMTDTDELDYEPSTASHREAEDYYSTWARGVLRVALFLGPGVGMAQLKLKAASALADVGDSHDLTAWAGTLLVVRQDTFEFSFSDPPEGGDALWLESFILRPGPQFTFDGQLEGDLGLLSTGPGDGPPAPTEALVAVVGLGIQSALKISNHHQEWAAYIGGTDGQLEMPLSRFDYHPYYDDEVDNPQGTTFVKHFSVQEGVELFDNKIFEISAAEGAAMDPMFRQIMEVGYVAIFNIGFTKKYANTNPTHASVSVGCDKQEWLNMPDIPRSVATNNQLAIGANRFNYVFNLKGGSYVCDTACSSTLVAAHLGKVNLLETRWDPLEFHLACGTGMTLTVLSFIGSCSSHMISPGGRCFTFNATANGYNRGDGTSGLLLKNGPNDEKRMAYLRGTQMGQDGRSASMSAPNGPAQEKCCWGAIREARMTPPESTVWDAHGTGTSLGDPIEIGAVRKVQIKMKRLEPLMIASSKSNFGHLEGSAAGIAMNKCVMIVIGIVCAPTIHLKTLNPHLDHTSFDAIFCTEVNPYKYKQGHCQVSSFGVGGTNGHGIFWGKGFEPEVDHTQIFFKKLMASPPPIVQDGSNPADWDFNGLPFDAKSGDRYRVILTRDDLTGEERFRYELQEDWTETPEFYATTGNHNDWDEDRMTEGDVPYVYYQEVVVPESGMVEFRILADGEQRKVIAPAETTSKRTAPILGPKEGLGTAWLAKAEPDSALRIELMAPPKGPFLITWFKIKDG